MPGHPREDDSKKDNEQQKPAGAPNAGDKKPAQNEPVKPAPEKREPDEDEKFHHL